MHHVAFQRFAVHRLKRAEPDVEGQLAQLHTPLADSFEYLLREVQTGGGSGNRPGPLGKYGLVTLAVRGVVRSFNVWRQRNVSEPLQMLIHGARAALPTLSKGETPLGAWLRGLLARAHVNTVVVALAAKLARIAWALIRRGEKFNMKAAAAL